MLPSSKDGVERKFTPRRRRDRVALVLISSLAGLLAMPEFRLWLNALLDIMEALKAL